MPRIVDMMQLVLVDQLLDGMSGGGRLPVGILDRLPILLAAGGWMLLAGWIGLPLVQLALAATGRLIL